MKDIKIKFWEDNKLRMQTGSYISKFKDNPIVEENAPLHHTPDEIEEKFIIPPKFSLTGKWMEYNKTKKCITEL